MIVVIFGTRPEFIKVAPIILELQKNDLTFKTINTGQHKEMLLPLFDWFGIQPDYNLAIMKPGQSLNGIIHASIGQLDSIFEQLNPSVVITQGDTTTAFVASLAAFNRRIKVAHVEAGLRTNDIYNPFPEEANRRLISQIAEYHFTPTQHNTQNLIHSGIDAQKIVETGNTVIDSLLFTTEKLKDQNHMPNELIERIERYDRLITFTGHRRENIGEGFNNIFNALKESALNNPNILYVYPVHLNPLVKDVAHAILTDVENVLLVQPMEYPGFVELMSKSYLIVSDSGGIQEEAPSLNVPVLVTRTNTERMEAVQSGAVKLVGTDKDMILAEIDNMLNNPLDYDDMKQAKNPYGNGTASIQIISALEKYGK